MAFFVLEPLKGVWLYAMVTWYDFPRKYVKTTTTIRYQLTQAELCFNRWGDGSTFKYDCYKLSKSH